MNGKRESQEGAESSEARTPLVAWCVVAVMVYLLLLAVDLINHGFKQATGGAASAQALFAFATNPFMGVLLGGLVTALVQSSSTVTSIIVGMVAGGLPVSVAIPMVMGANLGTTITNTLVSFGHVGNREEFRRAFAAATVHDGFNLLSILIFLPLEMAFGLLERLSGALVGLAKQFGSHDLGGLDFVEAVVEPVSDLIEILVSPLPGPWAGVALIVLGVVLILVAIIRLSAALRTVMVGKANQLLHTAVGRGPISGIVSGTVVTVVVQSSSTTTSLMVPLAGSGVFRLGEVYPFTLGANIGTTITALLAATVTASGSLETALQIALAHLLYNLLGVVVIYGIPWLRTLPMLAAEWLARVASERKGLAVAYTLGMFFVVPGVLAFAGTRLF